MTNKMKLVREHLGGRLNQFHLNMSKKVDKVIEVFNLEVQIMALWLSGVWDRPAGLELRSKAQGFKTRIITGPTDWINAHSPAQAQQGKQMHLNMLKTTIDHRERSAGRAHHINTLTLEAKPTPITLAMRQRESRGDKDNDKRILRGGERVGKFYRYRFRGRMEEMGRERYISHAVSSLLGMQSSSLPILFINSSVPQELPPLNVL